MTHTRVFTGALIAVVGSSACLAAGPMPLERRNDGLLVSDTQLDGIYLLRDLNGNDNAEDAGEQTLFFGGGNASNVLGATAFVDALYQADDGTVYFTDRDFDRVIAVRDGNDDGDAMDAGEARVFFESGTNAAGITFDSAAGIAGDAAGAIYVTAFGGPTPPPRDAVYRLVDLNNDGDANDQDEATVWFDAQDLLASSSPFAIAFVGNAAYFIDTLVGGVVRVADGDMNGTVGAGEFNVFVTETTFGVRIGLDIAGDGVSLYTNENAGTVGRSIFRLTDLDSGGTINAANEVEEIWTLAQAPAGAFTNGVGIAVGPEGRFAITSQGSGTADAVLLLRDLNTSRDFLETGETFVFRQGTAADTTTFPEQARAVIFYGAPCRADFDNQNGVQVADIFAFLRAWFANDPSADFDGENGIQVADIFSFLRAWFAGC